MTHPRIASALGPPALVLGLLLALLPAPAAAQDHRVSLTGYTGSAAYSSLADSADPGVHLASGGFNGGMAEWWFGRLGLRLHAGWADTHVDGEPGTAFGIVAGDADLVVRLRHPRPGLFFQPYGVVGLGAVRYDLGLDTSLVGGYPYESDPTVRGSLVLGIGADFLNGPVALRLELMDIIGASSPLSRTDTSHFGAVSHVVLTLGLSVRAGRIALAPPPERTDRPRPIRTTRPASPEPPRDSVPTPPVDSAGTRTDTAAAEPTAADTVRPPIRRPRPPTIDTTITPDTTAPPPRRLVPEAPDTTRKPPRGQPIDIAGPPVDTTGQPVDTTGPPVDTAGPPALPPDSLRPGRRPPIDRPAPPPVDTTVTVDTTAPPPTPTPPPVDTGVTVDTTDVEPPDTTDTTPTDSTQTQPPDTTGVEPPTDTTDGGGTRGRLFTVRIAWDPGDDAQLTAMNALVAALEEAGVPVWPVEADTTGQPGQRRGRGGGPEAESRRRVAALRNAADARTLGNHIEADYGLGWEWVHIDKDEDIAPEAVEASTAFVDGLEEGPGEGGRGGGG